MLELAPDAMILVLFAKRLLATIVYQSIDQTGTFAFVSCLLEMYAGCS